MVFLTPSRMGRPLCSPTFQRGDIIVACITKVRETDGPICRNRYRYFVFGSGHRPSALRICNDFCNTCIYPAKNYRATERPVEALDQRMPIGWRFDLESLQQCEQSLKIQNALKFKGRDFSLRKTSPEWDDRFVAPRFNVGISSWHASQKSVERTVQYAVTVIDISYLVRGIGHPRCGFAMIFATHASTRQWNTGLQRAPRWGLGSKDANWLTVWPWIIAAMSTES